MKKYLALILGVLFVLSFAASAFAIHAEIPAESQAVVAASAEKITLGGEIRTRGWYFDNLDADKISNSTHSAAWYDERVRLSVEANVAPGVVGYVQLETTSGDSTDKVVWGHADRAGVASVNGKSDLTFNLLQSWILYTGSGLFGFNSGLKIGHMPLQLAYGQFFNNTQAGDDAIVFFMDPIKPLHIAFLTFKGSEGVKTNNPDDLDAYVGLAVYKWDDKNNIGINYTYLNSPAVLGPGTDLQMSNLGLHADGNIAGLGYKAAVDVQFGSVGDGDAKADFEGWAASAYLNYMLNPVNLRGSFVYGSGQDNGSDIKEFVPFTGNTQNYSLIYEYNHRTTAFNPSGLNPAAPKDNHAAGVANTTYANLGVDYNPTKEMALSLDGYMFWATDTEAFETPGHSVDSSAGWEIDAKMKYQLAKNLTYQIDAGYFDEGDFFKDAYGSDQKGTTVLRHMLTLSF